MNDTNAKQQIVDRIKKSNNILVTVSNDPSVDELSAALGLTVLLNKMNKHATAVFSGAIPPAINFLEPDKTFENTVDSLRDFIIALDKEKADHLRYKVEGDVVKIFITPYRTTITSDDLDFSQGDYNVELVLALGVKNKDHLDGALMAHGRILHDATVATLSAGTETSDLGSISWTESGASSLSEMLVSLTDSLKADKALLDEQVATAFLTGLVAATDRFSNNRTSSKVMTIAAQLMAAGANQQLIALKLQEAKTISSPDASPASDEATNHDGTTDLAEDTSTKLSRDDAAPTEVPQRDGELNISHELGGDLDEVARATAALQQQAAADAAEAELAKRTNRKRRDQNDNDTPDEQELAEGLAATATPAVSPSVADLQQDLAAASEELSAAAQPVDGEPSLGGTLNATTEQAADEKRRALEHDQNHTILSHDRGEYIGDQTPMFQAPINAANDEDTEPSVPDIFQQSPNDSSAPTLHAAPIQPPEPVAAPTPLPEPVFAPEPPQPSGPTLAELDAQHRQPQGDDHAAARADVEAAFGAVPYEPAPIPLPSTAPAPTPEEPGPVPPMPPLPDFSTLPPLPPTTPEAPIFGQGPIPEPPQQLPPQPPADPGQFRIPGQ